MRLIAYNDTLNDLGTATFLTHGSDTCSVSMLRYLLCYRPLVYLGRISRLLRVIWVSALSVPDRLRKSHSSVDNNPEGPSLHQALLDAFWDDPTDVELLEEPYLSWHLARPGLLLAALLMAALTTTLGILVVQSIVNWIQYGQHAAASTIPQPLPSGIMLVDMFPINLIILDLSRHISGSSGYFADWILCCSSWDSDRTLAGTTRLLSNSGEVLLLLLQQLLFLSQFSLLSPIVTWVDCY